MSTRSPNVPTHDAVTTIGRAIAVQGQVSGEEDLQIEGRVDGSIQLTSTLIVAEGGVVVAEVDARDVVVSGVVVGNVVAQNSVTLNRGAKLVGDIAAPRVIIADGAAFRGNVAMSGEAPRPRERARSRPRAVTRPAASKAVAAKSAESKGDGARARVGAAIVVRDEGKSDDTIVVRHAALAQQGQKRRAGDARKTDAPAAKPARKPPKKKKKKAVRARVPKPAKRRVSRR